MHDARADSVRIQIAQSGMDPQNALFTPNFRGRAIGAIRSARAANLTVIVSVQNEPQSVVSQLWGSSDCLGCLRARTLVSGLGRRWKSGIFTN
jgi:hypothetical protein